MLEKIKKPLYEVYDHLCKDNTDLTNKKALDILYTSLSTINILENKVKKLQAYKGSFYLLAIINYSLIVLLICYLFQFHNIDLDRKIETKIINNYKRIITRPNKQVHKSYFYNKNKFLAKKIKELNPNADSRKVANLIIIRSFTAGIDPILVSAIIKFESNFNHQARSTANAHGLMQILPSTAGYIIKPKKEVNLYDIDHNLIVGIAYIKYTLKLFNHDKEKALMAYNWGPNKLLSSIKYNKPIPIKVQTYAKNILTTTSQWAKEFNKLEKEA